MKEWETLLKTVGDGLKILAHGVNAIADKLENFVEAKQADTTTGHRAESTPVDEAPAQTADLETSGMPEQTTRPPKKRPPSAAERVYETLSRAPGPVDIDLLAGQTGLEKKKLHNILYRLKKQGRIVNVSKGVYRKV